MNRLVNVAFFGIFGILCAAMPRAAVAEESSEILMSNFSELGVTLLEGREEIKTQVMLHDGQLSFSSCKGATGQIQDRLIRHINTNFIYYSYRVGCETSGLFTVRFTFELMIEPKTVEDQVYTTDWINRHNGVELGGKNAWFNKALIVKNKVTLMSGMVPAAGRGPLRVAHQKDATHEFVNYGESQVFVGKVAADIQRDEIDGVFDAAHRVLGVDGSGEYQEVLARVNYVRATALPNFTFEGDYSRNAWYYLYYDHDCRNSPAGLCL